MPRNKLVDLRNALFAELEGLQDKEEPFDKDRTKAICEVSRNILEAGRLQIAREKVRNVAEKDYLEFFDDPKDA